MIGTSATINDLTVASGATLTNNGTLNVAGNISNSGTLSSTAGTVVFNGGSPQTVAANTFTGNTIRDLTINNASGVTLGGPLGVTGVYTPTAGVLNSNGNLILKSTSAGTARVAQGTGTYVTGSVTVERYIPAKRAWRMLTAPLSNTGSIYANWQNNGVATGSTGAEIWGPSGTGSTGNGMAYGGATSMQSFSPAANNWVNLTSTKLSNLGGAATSASNNAYSMFITGPYGSNKIDPSTGAAATTLSATGSLQTGTQNFDFGSALPADNYILVGNPYASPVNFAGIGGTGFVNNSGNFKNTMWVWDPMIGTYGGYVTVSWNGSSYDVVPSSGTAQNQHLQSGQAFFVQVANGNTPTSITFNENNKSSTVINNVFKGRSITALDITLNRLDTGTTFKPVEGVLAQFATNYKPEVGVEDAEKLWNYDENMALRRGEAYLSIERRNIAKKTDTLYIYVASFKKDKQYSFTIKPTAFPASVVTAYLQDNYLHTDTKLSLTKPNEIMFNVTTAAGSYAPERFRIVFTRSNVVARTDGSDAEGESFSIYPNPTTVRKVTLQLGNIAKGTYNLQVFDKGGRQVITKKIVHDGIVMTQPLQLPQNMTAGSYQVILTDEQGSRFTQQLILQ